ncbi:MAG: NADH-quinone oxidoreductase subunit A [Elusimicrobia bacterium]|nr:NADH-quinone oxidoreductase subunit A [Elusimicrobiota bacterium]
MSYLIAPDKPSKEKLSTYECGEPPVGFAWVQYNVRYYIFVLMFLIFDVETIFLFPWAVSFRDIGMIALTEMFVFLSILLLGLAYAWRKGALEWS